MDYEKLIEQLKGISNGLVEDEFPKCANAVRQAATALSTLQAENKRLKSLLGESGQDLWSKENQRADRLEAENEKLRAELEQVKRERDAAVEYLRGQCRYCKNNLVCTSRKGPHFNCWEWRGPKKED